jgi:hypothetical protein
VTNLAVQKDMQKVSKTVDQLAGNLESPMVDEKVVQWDYQTDS